MKKFKCGQLCGYIGFFMVAFLFSSSSFALNLACQNRGIGVVSDIYSHEFVNGSWQWYVYSKNSCYCDSGNNCFTADGNNTPLGPGV